LGSRNFVISSMCLGVAYCAPVELLPGQPADAVRVCEYRQERGLHHFIRAGPVANGMTRDDDRIAPGADRARFPRRANQASAWLAPGRGSRPRRQRLRARAHATGLAVGIVDRRPRRGRRPAGCALLCRVHAAS
jgi:hypothetical protein